MEALPEIAIPPLSLTDPVINDADMVESDTTKVPDKFALVENVFHLLVDEPKLKPVVPGINASVPPPSFTVTNTFVTEGAEPGEYEPLYPTKEMVSRASPLIEMDS